MKNKIFLFLCVFLSLAFVSNYTFAKDREGAKPSSNYKSLNKTNASGKNGDSYRLNINNVNLPLNNRGIIAAVNIPPANQGAGGRYANEIFLFSSGFFMSGYTNGTLWANGVASASLVEDYVPGTYEFGENDSRNVVYVVKRTDPAFSQSWQDWKDAVILGADFYDGDGDGVYNPTDKNGNGIWDADEDMPDLLGDETVWTVYSDNKPSSQRRYSGVTPQGIEIRQTVFAFASKGAIGNIIFVRYRIRNTGAVADVLNNVYFGVWADPDLGEPTDDLVGSDIALNAGYVYNGGEDATYGANPPAFLIDFFSGPAAFIPGETFTDDNGNGIYDEGEPTLDTAYSVRGQLKGLVEIPGARNLGISSFIHYQQGEPPIQDPNNETELRYYMEGMTQEGTIIDPCTWTLGVVSGVDCATIDNRFWYSGDPVTGIGWINTKETDQRQMQNTGPFELKAGAENEVEIVAAYIVGQGRTGAVSSVAEAKRIDLGAQFIFDLNFATPSAPPPVTIMPRTDDEHIDLYFDVFKQVSDVNQSSQFDMKFEGFKVYALRTENADNEFINGIQNYKVIGTYDVDNFINDVYKQDEFGIPRILYPANPDNQLDFDVYSDSTTGKLKITIDRDPFTGGPLIKGKPYYFGVAGYAINHMALSNLDTNLAFGTPGDYVLSNQSFFGEAENSLSIPVGNMVKVYVGQDQYDLTTKPLEAEKTQGATGVGNVAVDFINKDALTGDTYEVTFEVDSSTAIYSTTFDLRNVTTGELLIDNSKDYLYGSNNVARTPTEGFILKVSEEAPEIGEVEINTATNWINEADAKFFYVPKDLPQSSKVSTLPGLTGANGNYVKADKLKRVVIRFGDGGKAYRYLNGFVGSNITKRNSYVYAEAVTAADTTVNGAVGKLGEGFVDVPFTAWIEDDVTGIKRQLAVGFIERSSKLPGGNPDGQWTPGTNLAQSLEYILVFNSDYDPNGGQQVYKGATDGTTTSWADLRGGANYNVAGSNFTPDEVKMAKSPYFDALYVVALPRVDVNNFYTAGDEYIIPVENYPYTPEDKFIFQTQRNGELTTEQKKQLFENVNVFPNPLFGFNVATSYEQGNVADDPFITFSNLPEEVTVKIYSLSGQLLRTLTTADKMAPSSQFLRWNLQNESGLRVASGMYMAIVSSPNIGEKILKFAVILPQKQLPKY